MTTKRNKTYTKRLSAVEVDKKASNQHELNGVSGLKRIFGETKTSLPINFSIQGEKASYNSNVTWYNAREKHPTRNEYRLYFENNPVMTRATEGDQIKIGFDSNQQLFCELIKNPAKASNDELNKRVKSA